MRVGRPITEKMQGQGRTLGSKLGWFFQSRRRISIFVLVLTIIVGVSSYGAIVLKDKNTFKAAEDDTELLGYDYVEYMTSEVMGGQLDSLTYDTPLGQVNNYSYSYEDTLKLAIRLTELNYFRLPSKDDRQALLGQQNALSDDAEDNTRLVALVDYLETQPNGSYVWLDQFNRGNFSCPDDGDKTGMDKTSQSIAHAQGVMRSCDKEVLAAQEKKNRDAYWQNVNANYDIWDGFYKRAHEKFNSFARNQGQNLEAFLYKQYWSSADLDFLYNNIFPDTTLKQFRNDRQFVLERQFLEGTLKAYKIVRSYKSQGLKDVTIDIAAFFFPPARGGKGIAGLFEAAAANRVKHPFAVGNITFTTAAGEVSVPIVDGALAGESINLTRAFANAEVLIRKGTLLSDGQLVAAQAPKALDRLMKSKYVPKGVLTREMALHRLKKTQYLSQRSMALMDNGVGFWYAAPSGMYLPSTGEILINESIFRTILGNLKTSLVIHTHTHEYLHSLSVDVFGPYFSMKLGYNPLEEGLTEYLAQKISAEFTSGTISFEKSYSHEVSAIRQLISKLAEETYIHGGGRMTREQADKAVLNRFMQLYYGEDQGVAFNKFVGTFLDSSNPYYKSITVDFGGDIAEWITTAFKDNHAAALRRFINALKLR